MNISRRGLILGMGAAIAAPAIVRYASIMPVRVFDEVEIYRGLITIRTGLPSATWRLVHGGTWPLPYHGLEQA